MLTLAWAVARFWVIRSGRPKPATVELILAGAACGVAAHFVRDIATAPMSFWWPLTSMAVEVPYWWYVAACAVLIVLPVTRRRRDLPDRLDHQAIAAEPEIAAGQQSA
jgi:hypothetical protein